MNTTEKIAKLQEQLKELEQEQKAEREAKRKSTKRVFRFEIKPYDKCWDRLYDDTLKWYYLSGKVLNQKELEEAGWSSHESANGGMAYLYNSSTKKIALRSGGGTIYIPEEAYLDPKKGTREEVLAETIRVFSELASFIDANPDGGDVTDIITSHKFFSW